MTIVPASSTALSVESLSTNSTWPKPLNWPVSLSSTNLRVWIARELDSLVNEEGTKDTHTTLIEVPSSIPAPHRHSDHRLGGARTFVVNRQLLTLYWQSCRSP